MRTHERKAAPERGARRGVGARHRCLAGRGASRTSRPRTRPHPAERGGRGQAVRAEERDPVTKTDVGREELQSVNRGQEMPFLLSATPAVNVQSDTGLAAGYSYFNIRGIGQTRLNLTLDGVPLQDPEDQALYFSNFGDFASVVDSVQVQRGVGTSSVGSASYGGSVNFASVSPADRRGVEAQVRRRLVGDGPGHGGRELRPYRRRLGPLRPTVRPDD